MADQNDRWNRMELSYLDSLGPIRLTSDQKTLTADQEERVRLIYEYLLPYLDLPFEHFEFSFVCQDDPEHSVRVWSQVVLGHLEFLDRYPEASDDDGRDVFRCLLHFVAGDDQPDDVPPKLWRAVYRFCTGR